MHLRSRRYTPLRLCGALTCVTLAAAALVSSIGAWQIVRSHHAALRAAEEDTATLVRALAQHAARTIETVDVSLGMVVDQVESGRDPIAVTAYLRARGALSQLRNLAITDSTGAWLADTAPPHPIVDSADRPYFLWFVDRDTRELYFAPPVIGRTSHLPGLPVSRRINRPDKTFAGVAVATLAPEYFDAFYANVHIGPHGTVALWTKDGNMLVRYPAMPQTAARGPIVEAAKTFATANGGMSRSVSPFDGVERIFAFEHVGAYPLVVSAAVSIDDALASWRHDAFIEGAVVLAAAMMLSVLGLMLERRRSYLVRLEKASRDADRALAESEVRYRSLVEDQSEMISLAAPDGRLRFVNPAYARCYDRTPDDMIGRSLFDFVPMEYRETVQADWRRVVATTGPQSNENQIVLPDGSRRWIAWTNRALVDADGGVTAIHSVGRDIEARVAAERRLAASKDRLRHAYEATPAILHSIDANGRLRMVSDAWLKRLGYARDEVIGRPSTDFLTSESRERARSIVLPEFFREGRADNVAYQMIAKDGQIFDVEMSAILDHDETDGSSISLAATMDVTLQKAAERKLIESEASYRMLASSTSDVLAKITLDCESVYVSPACQTVLGYEPDELMGRFPPALVDERDRDQVRALTEAMVAGAVVGSRATIKYRMRHKDGRQIWIEAAMSLVRDPCTGAPESIICSMRDVSERQRVAEELDKARIAAESAARAKADFVANMSHELRTPLAGIIGVLDVLSADASIQDSQRRLLDLAGHAGRSLVAIVNDILDFSKIDAGQLAIESVPFDLDDVVRSCHELALGSLGGRNLEISLHVEPKPLGQFSGDSTRIRQVLLNLLTNAVKFTTAGRIAIEVAYAEAAGILRIEVSDTGIGIPEDRIEALFERFTQADTSMTRRYGGTGLGLAICKRLVELMDGRIGASNRTFGGALFWFELPLKHHADTLAAHAAADTGPVTPVATARRILLAEDNAINAEIVVIRLNAQGHEVSVVRDGASAVEAVLAQSFDLVLMDMQMPIMDGLAATRRIRDHEKAVGLRRIPVIGLTANALSVDADRCLDAGMDGHVAKPIDWRTLFAAVEKLATSQDGEPAEAIVVSGDPSILDLERLDELSSLMGRERLAGLLGRFVEDLAHRLASLEASDAKGLSDQMHALISVSGQFGFIEFGALCADIERQAILGGGLNRIVELRKAASRASGAIRHFNSIKAA